MLFSLGSGIVQVPIIMRVQDLAGNPAKPITTAIGAERGRARPALPPNLYDHLA